MIGAVLLVQLQQPRCRLFNILETKSLLFILDYNNIKGNDSIQLNIMNLKQIIKEVINEIYYEDDYEAISDVYEKLGEMIYKLFSDFLYENNQDMTKNVSWQLIPFNRLKKILEDFIRTKLVRDEKGIDYIEAIMYRNILKIMAFTMLLGHQQDDPEEHYEQHLGQFVDEFLESDKNKPEYAFLNKLYEEDYLEDDENRRTILYEALKDRFMDYYAEDPKSGQAYISDFGLRPLEVLLKTLLMEREPEKKIVTIDKMLNVIHQRSDIAAWFIEGGTKALSDISGYYGAENDKDDSVVSGQYRMHDYR
jgi:hypothetical protein